MATKILQKSSVSKIIWALALRISEPVFIAKPTSEALRAGVSLVPSPVTATTSFSALKPVTSNSLCSGADLARTLRFYLIFLNIFMSFNYFL